MNALPLPDGRVLQGKSRDSMIWLTCDGQPLMQLRTAEANIVQMLEVATADLADAKAEVRDADRGLELALLDLDAALTRFSEVDKTKADLVKLRYFAGCSIKDAAELLGISTATADRYWAYSRAWLQTEMNAQAR